MSERTASSTSRRHRSGASGSTTPSSFAGTRPTRNGTWSASYAAYPWSDRLCDPIGEALDAAIPDRLGDVLARDRGSAGEVGDGPRDAGDTIERAGRDVPASRSEERR